MKAIEELNRPGWEGVYETVRRLICQQKMPGGPKWLPCILLTGNPGTGKTAIGNILGRVLYEEELLPTDRVCQAGKACGVQQAAAAASGGVLLIDALDTWGKGEFFHLPALVECITDPARDYCVVAMGYPDTMEKLMQENPALARVFTIHIHIADFNDQVMYEIFVDALEKRGYTADEQTLAVLRQLTQREYEHRTPYTGNARYVLNMLNAMEMKLVVRCMENKIPLDSPEGRRFCPEDVSRF